MVAERCDVCAYRCQQERELAATDESDPPAIWSSRHPIQQRWHRRRTCPAADYTEEDVDKVIAINLRGVWLGMKTALPQMLKQKRGVIVNNASILGLVGFVNAIAYTAAKHAVLGMTKVAAMEYAAQGIRINA